MTIKNDSISFHVGRIFSIQGASGTILAQISPNLPKRTKEKHDLQKNVCTLTLGAILVKSRHIQQFCEGFHTFCPNFNRHCRIFTKSEVLGVRSHPRLLHRIYQIKNLYTKHFENIRNLNNSIYTSWQHCLRDRQQLMLLHCCPQLETWHLKNCARYLAGRINLVGGPDAAWGPLFGYPDVDWKEVVTPLSSPIPTVNSRDLFPPARTQTSEEEHSDLRASNRRPSTPQPTPKHSPKLSARNPIVCFLEVDNTCVNVFGILPRFLKNLLESEIHVCSAMGTMKTALGIIRVFETSGLDCL